MRAPHPDRRPPHALQPDARVVLIDVHLHPPGLEPAALIVHEPRLRGVGQLRADAALVVGGGGHPAEQRLQLAAVADAEGEGVGAVVEVLELLQDALVETDGPLGGVGGWGVERRWQVGFRM